MDTSNFWIGFVIIAGLIMLFPIPKTLKNLLGFMVLCILTYTIFYAEYFSPGALIRRAEAAHLEVKAACVPAREFAPFSYYEPFAKGHETYAKLSDPNLWSLTKTIPSKDIRRRLVGAEMWRRHIAKTGHVVIYDAEQERKDRAFDVWTFRTPVLEFLRPLAAAGNVNAIADLGTLMFAAHDSNPFLRGVNIWKSGVEKIGADPVLSKLIADYESQCKPQYVRWEAKWGEVGNGIQWGYALAQ